MTWSEDDRLRDDEKGHDARLRRVNEAIRQRDSAFTEAAKQNRDGWASYSPEERLERENAADQQVAEVFETELAECRAELAKLDQQIADVGAPLVGMDAAALTRQRETRAAVRDELTRSTVDEIERAAGAAIRSGDRQLARAWAGEIAEHLRVTEMSSQAAGRLIQLANSIRDQAEDPADVRRRKDLQRRRAQKQKHVDELRAATHDTRVAMDSRAMATSGLYAPL